MACLGFSRKKDYDMANLLPQILSFPPVPAPAVPLSDQAYDNGIKEQISLLKKASNKSLLTQTSSGEYLYNILNPNQNTVPYAFVILAMIDGRSKMATEDEFVLRKINTFLSHFDARQIRYIGDEFTKIVNCAIKLIGNQPNRAPGVIASISKALIRLDPEGSVLTSIHVQLVDLALTHRYFDYVIDVISRPIHYFPAKIPGEKVPNLCSLNLPNHAYISPATRLTLPLDTAGCLNYFILAGCICLVLEHWEQAAELLEGCMNYPTKDGVCSKIMAEAYKKWILACLLYEGKVDRSVSNYCLHPNAHKSLIALGKPYDRIAELFTTGTALQLKQEVDFGRNVWREDYNTGLMAKVLSAYQKHQIRKLANVYSAIPISSITAKTCSAETGKQLASDADTERIVREMISDGDLVATVRTTPDNVQVLYFDDGEILSESLMEQRLGSAIRSMEDVRKNIKQTDHRLTEDREYLKWAAKQRRAGNNAPVNNMYAAGGSEENDPTFNGPDVMDEDLMSV